MLLLMAILMLSLSCLSGCGVKVVVIPADREIKQAPDGVNYIVTPAWLQERYQHERWMQEELDKCKN